MDKFDWSPRRGFQRQSKPRVNVVKFGDGYEQRSPDGQNSNMRTYPISIRDETDEVMRMETFLSEHGGVQAFIFTPYGEWVDRTVVCDEWSIAEFGRYSELTATFREVVA